MGSWSYRPDFSCELGVRSWSRPRYGVFATDKTRQALRDGTNGFERILPGPDRMYPDTDLPPRRIPHDHLERLRHTLTEPFWEREKRYAELRVPEDLARCLSISPLFGLFDTAVRDWHLSPVLAATVLVQYPKRLARTLRRRVEIPEETLSRILVAHRDGLLAKEGILPLLRRVAEGGPSAHEDLPAPCRRKSLPASSTHLPPRCPLSISPTT